MLAILTDTTRKGRDHMSPNVRTALLLPTFIVLSNSVKWASSDSKHTLPKSLFLAKAPDFFAGYRWPWADTVGSTKFYTLPAKAHYDAGRPFSRL